MKNVLISTTLLTMLSVSAAYAIDQGIQGKKIGDVISIRTNDEIAKWCDFSKQIVLTNTNVLCIYNGAEVQANRFGKAKNERLPEPV